MRREGLGGARDLTTLVARTEPAEVAMAPRVVADDMALGRLPRDQRGKRLDIAADDEEGRVDVGRGQGVEQRAR